MKRFCSALLILSLSLTALSGCKPASEAKKSPPTAGKAVSKAERPGRSYILEKHGDYQVRIYGQPLSVVLVDYVRWNPSEPESGYLGYYSASQRLDPDWMVQTYAPEDRDTAKRLVSDDGQLMALARENQQISQEQILERVTYQGYAILKVERSLKNGEQRTQFVPMKKTPEGWLLTDDLDNDPFYRRLALQGSELPIMEIPESR